MTVVVINLERSSARRELMQRTLNRLGIQFEFFRGIDASHGEHLCVSSYDEQARLLDHRQTLTPGEIGCFASHYLLWQRCVEEQEPIIIMEDDLLIEDRFTTALAAAEALINRFHLIRLGILPDGAPFGRFCDLEENLQMIRYAKNSILGGTQCYALSPKGAAALVRHAAVWSLSADHYLSAYKMHGPENYGIRPYFVKHADQEIYTCTIHSRVEESDPAVSFRLVLKRGLRQFRHDKQSGLYQLLYRFSQLRCALFRLLLPGALQISVIANGPPPSDNIKIH